jgi:CDP-glucose 4,6-dehydratase
VADLGVSEGPAKGSGSGVDPAFWAGRRVLLTGHTGFKGTWLLMLLERMGAEVTGLSLDPPTRPSMFEQVGGARRCRHHVGDIRDLGAVIAAVDASQPQTVLHLAAQPLVRRSYDDPLETYSTNVMGTANLLEAVRDVRGLRSVVSVTTDKCYENDGRTEGYREDARLGGHDPYSNSKACAELVTQSFRDSFYACRRIGLATARAGNVIGGGDYAPDRLVPDCARAFGEGRMLELRNPAAVRPWQHVLEPIVGYLTLAQRLEREPERYAGGWNFGPAAADLASVSHVVELAARHWGVTGGWTRQPGDHPHEAAMLTLDSTKAIRHLGWTPALALADAVGWSAEWYRQIEGGESAARVTCAQIDDYFARMAAEEGRVAA